MFTFNMFGQTIFTMIFLLTILVFAKIRKIAQPDQELFKIDYKIKPYDVKWNYDGILLAVPCDKKSKNKIKYLRIIDPRNYEVTTDE